MTLRRLDGPREDRLETLPSSALGRGVTEPFGSHQHQLANRWAVLPDPSIEPIAHYTGDPSLWGMASVAEAGRRSTYIGVLYAPPALLRNLARAAGVHIYCATDDIILGDGRFLAIHAAAAGRKTLHLPEPMQVTDALTGETLARDTRVPLVMEQGETRLLWVHPECR